MNDATNGDAAVDVSIIVLGWNGRAYLADCIESLLAQDTQGLRCEILYVDNGSRDGSLDFVRERFSSIRTVALDHNYGYAEGNNIGARHAHGRVIVFLNQDTVVHRRCVRTLVAELDDETIGACHANIVQPWYAEFAAMDVEGDIPSVYTADLSKLAYVRYRRIGSATSPVDTLFLHGVCIAILRDVLDRLDHAFDPDFFAYAEDMDLALRLHALGLRTVVVPEAIVYHKHTLKTEASLRTLRHTVRIVRNRALALYKVMSVREYVAGFLIVMIGAPFNVTEFGLPRARRVLYFLALVPVTALAAATTLLQLPRYADKRRRVLRSAPRPPHTLRRLLRQPW